MQRKVSLKSLADFSGRITAREPRRNPGLAKATTRKMERRNFSLGSHTVSTIIVSSRDPHGTLSDENVDPTAVIGAVAAELQMQPVPSVEYGEFERKSQMSAQSKKPVKLLDEVIKNNILNPGTTGAVMNRQFLKITVRVIVRASSLFVEATLAHITAIR